MGVYFILALVVSLLPVRVYSGLPRSVFGTSRALPIAVAVALVATFATYMTVFEGAVMETQSQPFMRALPLHFILGPQRAAPRYADALLACVAIECALLAMLFATIERLESRQRRIVAGGVAIAMAVLALAARVADSPDAYAYAGYAVLGVRAFAPPAMAFPGDLGTINAIWSAPMLPSIYGPVWIGVSAAAVAPFATLAGKIFALKLFGVATVFVCALLCRSMGASPPVIAAVACNPAFYLAYGADAHNDLFSVDLVLAAMLAARRSAPVAYAFAVAATLTKLVMLPVAISALAFATPRTRALFAAALVAGVALAYALGNGVMVRALLTVTQSFSHQTAPLDVTFRWLLAAIVVFGAGWTIVTSRVRAQGALAFPALGQFPLPQYFVWGLPVALTSTPFARAFLVTLPLLTFLQSTVMPATRAFDLAGAAFLVAALVVLFGRLRLGQPPARAAK